MKHWGKECLFFPLSPLSLSSSSFQPRDRHAVKEEFLSDVHVYRIAQNFVCIFNGKVSFRVIILNLRIFIERLTIHFLPTIFLYISDFTVKPFFTPCSSTTAPIRFLIAIPRNSPQAQKGERHKKRQAVYTSQCCF